jgi:hypothetical protein
MIVESRQIRVNILAALEGVDDALAIYQEKRRLYNEIVYKLNNTKDDKKLKEFDDYTNLSFIRKLITKKVHRPTQFYIRAFNNDYKNSGCESDVETLKILEFKTRFKSEVFLTEDELELLVKIESQPLSRAIQLLVECLDADITAVKEDRELLSHYLNKKDKPCKN